MCSSRRATSRTAFLLVVAAVATGAVTAPSGASAQAPQVQDRVFTTGSTSAGVFFPGPLISPIVIDARSGPSGEEPSGQLSFTITMPTGTDPIVIDVEGTVSCLSVAGNAAVIGFPGRFPGQFLRVRVTDGGGPSSGLDTFALELLIPSPPSPDCSSFDPSFAAETVTEGDITVVDATPLPTSKEQCKNGGWKNYGTAFRNQGQCVAFVQRGPQP